MNNEQAIKILKEEKSWESNDRKIDAFNLAIKALEEVQKYRELGTPEECKEALEKQTPKQPGLEGDGYADGHLVYDTWICPCCGKPYEVDYEKYDYCPNCGQAIDWSEE